MESLIADSKEPENVSLAAFRLPRINGLSLKTNEREWKVNALNNSSKWTCFPLGTGDTNRTRPPFDKIPYKFKYQFEDVEGRTSTMAIEDWEIGALYRKCLARAEGDEDVAIAKVRQKYETEFIGNKEISFFLGTTLVHHRKRHTNPFTIIGVFYPPRVNQQDLFD